jgi:hypothetical protein
VAGTIGLNRDHLAHVLSSSGKKQTVWIEGETVEVETRFPRKTREQGKGGGRPSRYQDKAFVALLTRSWEDHGRPWGKVLSPLLRGIIAFLTASRGPDYGISDARKVLLVPVSGAQIVRLLVPARKALELRGIRTTRATGTSLRSQVPVQTRFDRKAVKPGDVAFDTVPRLPGNFARP